jgi:hypothetical protein
MTRRHSLGEALTIAESLPDDGPDYPQVRELRRQLRALLKDAEATA